MQQHTLENGSPLTSQGRVSGELLPVGALSERESSASADSNRGNKLLLLALLDLGRADTDVIKLFQSRAGVAHPLSGVVFTVPSSGARTEDLGGEIWGLIVPDQLARTMLGDALKCLSTQELREELNVAFSEAERQIESECAKVRLLTPRKQQIVALVAEGFSNKQIARRLAITEGNVKMHLHKIFRKTKIANRTCLATIVQRSIDRHL